MRQSGLRFPLRLLPKGWEPVGSLLAGAQADAIARGLDVRAFKAALAPEQGRSIRRVVHLTLPDLADRIELHGFDGA